jgi:hypothetical protein
MTVTFPDRTWPSPAEALDPNDDKTFNIPFDLGALTIANVTGPDVVDSTSTVVLPDSDLVVSSLAWGDAGNGVQAISFRASFVDPANPQSTKYVLRFHVTDSSGDEWDHTIQLRVAQN